MDSEAGQDAAGSQERETPASPPTNATAAPAGKRRASQQSQTAPTEPLQEITEAIKDLSQETNTLIRQEIALAKQELIDKGKKAGLGGGMFGAAGVLALFAGGAFTTFLILVLSTFMTPRRAALVVTAVFGATAGALALGGKKKVEEAAPLVPGQAIEAAKRTKGRVQQALQTSLQAGRSSAE